MKTLLAILTFVVFTKAIAQEDQPNKEKPPVKTGQTAAAVTDPGFGPLPHVDGRPPCVVCIADDPRVEEDGYTSLLPGDFKPVHGIPSGGTDN